MGIEPVDLNMFFSGQDVQTDFQRRQGGKQMGPHKIRQGEAACGCPEEQWASGIQARHALAGKVVVAQKSAAVRFTFQGFPEQQGKEPVPVHLHPGGLTEFGKQANPGVDVACAVVAVDHGHRRAGRSRHHVDFAVNSQRTARNNHGKITGSGGHIAGADPYGIRRRHTGARVALRRSQRDSRAQIPGRVQEFRACFGQRSGVFPGGQDLGEYIPETPVIALF